MTIPLQSAVPAARNQPHTAVAVGYNHRLTNPRCSGPLPIHLVLLSTASTYGSLGTAGSRGKGTYVLPITQRDGTS